VTGVDAVVGSDPRPGWTGRDHVRRVQVIGAGDLGRRVFEGLAQSGRALAVQLVGRDPECTLRAANLTRFASLQRGYAARVSHAVTDLFDVARTAEQIAAFDPDVIFLAASLQSWWVISTLPAPAHEALSAAHFGPWLPMHLVPVRKAMEAIRLSGTNATVINAAFPDAVHPALDAIGLAPDIGIGNVANNVPGIRVAAAERLGIDPVEVDVRLVAHHYVSHRLSRTGNSGTAELGLRVLSAGEDISDQLDLPAVLNSLPGRYRRTGGLAGQGMTAASALSVLEPLIDGRDALVHAPGPLGLAGGYPVNIEGNKIGLLLPPGMTEREALQINLSGQRHDGISQICPDGTVLFEPSAMQVLTRELGYRCDRMPLSEAADRAEEIAARLTRYRERLSA